MGVALNYVLPVELRVNVEVGVLEDVRVVVVTYDLVAYGIGRLAVNRVIHIPPPVLGADGLLIAHGSRLPSYIVVKGTVEKGGRSPSQRRNTGDFSDSFHRRGIYVTGGLTLASKMASTVINVGESKAPSSIARLTMSITRQKINLLVGVK